MELIIWFETRFDVTIDQSDLTLENFGNDRRHGKLSTALAVEVSAWDLLARRAFFMGSTRIFDSNECRSPEFH